MGLFGKLFGSPDWGQLFTERKAILVDVRTPQEYKNGHVKGSLNMPLQSLEANWQKLQNKGPVVVCCASGARSGMAKTMLKRKGITEVYNIGPWHRANRYF